MVGRDDEMSILFLLNHPLFLFISFFISLSPAFFSPAPAPHSLTPFLLSFTPISLFSPLLSSSQAVDLWVCGWQQLQHLPCYAQGSEHSMPLAQAGGGAERNRLAIWRPTYGWCGTHSHNCRLRRSEIERGILTPLNQSQEKEEFERGTNVKGSLFEKEA